MQYKNIIFTADYSALSTAINKLLSVLNTTLYAQMLGFVTT